MTANNNPYNDDDETRYLLYAVLLALMWVLCIGWWADVI